MKLFYPLRVFLFPGRISFSTGSKSPTSFNPKYTLLRNIVSPNSVSPRSNAFLLLSRLGISPRSKWGDWNSPANIADANDSCYGISPSRKEAFIRLWQSLATSSPILSEKKSISSLIKIRSYRGFRHMRGYPVRGQRTRSNAKTSRRLAARRLSRITRTHRTNS